MILFLNEERAYLSWVTHHRRGFVLDGRHKPRLSQLVLHRATCPAVKSVASRRVHFTTGAKLKACSLDRRELEAWVAAQSGPALAECGECRPASDAPPTASGNAQPSKLGREILDYVLDAAVIHFEHEYPPYRLTIADISACFGKTPGQLRPVIDRLIEDGFLIWAGSTQRASSALHQVLLPTGQALRTLPAFRDESDVAIAAELLKLDPLRHAPIGK